MKRIPDDCSTIIIRAVNPLDRTVDRREGREHVSLIFERSGLGTRSPANGRISTTCGRNDLNVGVGRTDVYALALIETGTRRVVIVIIVGARNENEVRLFRLSPKNTREVERYLVSELSVDGTVIKLFTYAH